MVCSKRRNRTYQGMTKYKDKEAKEAPYMRYNSDVESVCSGFFCSANGRVTETCKNRSKCFKYRQYKENPKSLKKVGFRYVGTFRDCNIHKTEEDRIINALKYLMYSMLYINDLACSCVIDMKDKIYGQDKETRKIFGALIKRQDHYEKTINYLLRNNINEFADFNLEMDEDIKDKRADLYISILNFLKHKGVDNAEFIACVEIAYLIADWSVNYIETRVDECVKYNPNVVNLRTYELLGMRDVLRSLSRWATRNIKTDIDLNESEEIKTSFRELQRSITDYEKVRKYMIKTLNY